MAIYMRDQYIYEYALQHLRQDLARIEALIETTRAALGTSPKQVSAVPDESVPDWVLSAPEKAARAAAGEKPARKKRTLSPEARASIAAAQQKRWAAFHKEAKEAESKPEPKKPMAKKKRGKKNS